MYTGTKQGSNFQIKDKTEFYYKHDLVYYVKCPECHEDYIGEIGRRLHEWICDEIGKDSKSHMLKHSLEINHKHNSFEDFCILRNGYTNSKFKLKISNRCLLKGKKRSFKGLAFKTDTMSRYLTLILSFLMFYFT